MPKATILGWRGDAKGDHFEPVEWWLTAVTTAGVAALLTLGWQL